MVYRLICQDTVYFLDEWLHDNCKGEYNLEAWVDEANNALNNLSESESVAVLEMKSWETTSGHCLTFTFQK